MTKSFQFGLDKIADAFQKEQKLCLLKLKISSIAFLTVAFESNFSSCF